MLTILNLNISGFENSVDLDQLTSKIRTHTVFHSNCKYMLITGATVKPTKRPLSKRPKIGFHGQLYLNAGQKYCRMLKESILHTFDLH